MKKYLYLILLVFSNIYSQKEKLIDNTWVIDYYLIGGVKSLPTNKNSNDKIIFNTNNTFNLVEEDEKINGTWSYLPKKRIINIKIDGFPIEVPLKVKLLNENVFAWEGIDEKTGLKKITYMKKL